MTNTLNRAWYRLEGKLVPARGAHGSITLAGPLNDPRSPLAHAADAAQRNGHPLVEIRAVKTPGEVLVAAFESHLGLHEIGSSNEGPQINIWNERCHVPLGSPWCASCATCIATDAGYPPPGGPCASVADARQRAQDAGDWITTPSLWQPGYLLCVAGDEHMGMLISIDAATRTLTYISGNTLDSDAKEYNGGMVEIHTESIDAFEGAIRTWW